MEPRLDEIGIAEGKELKFTKPFRDDWPDGSQKYYIKQRNAGENFPSKWKRHSSWTGLTGRQKEALY